METLSHLKVLITRPEHQSKKLASVIQTEGGIPLFFPSIEIVPADNTMFLSETIKKIDHYDLVIFISPNAVLQSARYIRHFWSSWPKKTKLIAIGPGTEATLKTFNLSVDYRPEKNFNSAGLLALSALQNPKQKKILICQGENGCLSLISTLEKRSAHVNTLNLYKRQCPRLIKNNVPKQNEVDVIICTSNTGLKNLVSLLQAYWHDALFDKQLLVISPRIAEFAEKLGFVKAPLISDNANNEAILHTLKIYAKREFEDKS